MRTRRRGFVDIGQRHKCVLRLVVDMGGYVAAASCDSSARRSPDAARYVTEPDERLLAAEADESGLGSN